MEKSCEEIFELLVDFTDGRLSPDQSVEVTKHLAKCPQCRENLKALDKSLKLANFIWADSLTDIESVHVVHLQKARKYQWAKYAAVAATILIAFGIYGLFRPFNKPPEPQPTFAEIEQSITDAGNAARLLTAAERLSEYPDCRLLAIKQYKYILNQYPETSSAKYAKLKINNLERRL